MIDWSLRIPWGYGTEYRTLSQVRTILLAHYHPEYVRRLCAWLHSKGGKVGIGGHWRSVQPSQTGFAAPGKSFHQDQTFADGFVGAAAVDLVYEDGADVGREHDGIPWSQVPQQGSAEAKRWGVHCNIGNPSLTYPQAEPWHMQPTEIDGFDSWVAAGRPAPRLNYPLPLEVDMRFFCIDRLGTQADPVPVWVTTDGITAVRLPSYLGHRAAGLEVIPAETASQQFAFVNALEFVPRP